MNYLNSNSLKPGKIPIRKKLPGEYPFICKWDTILSDVFSEQVDREAGLLVSDRENKLTSISACSFD